MARGWSHKVEVALLASVGLVCLVFLLQSSDAPVWEEPREAVVPASPVATKAPAPAVSAAAAYECHEDPMASNVTGFAELPDHIKDFLRYKHCRRFRLILDAPGKCGTPEASRGVFLLLAVKSSPANYERREVIRKTWGQERAFAGLAIRRLFLVGRSANWQEDRKLGRLLRLEAEEHGDVLQWDFWDTFFNLTLKQSLFHAWLAGRCPEARFIFNGDDDVFAHTDNMVHYLSGLPGGGDRHLFVGQLIANVGPIREKWSKYYVPEQVTAARSYPPYCGGGGLLMSGFTAAAIHQAGRALELFPIDDVFLGMCLREAGLAPASHMGVRTVGVHVPSSTLESFDPCYYQELLLVHRFVPYEILLMWKAIHEPDLVCGKKAEVYHSL